MAIKKKVGKERLDKYYRLAKEQGFRARSAFKLIQLNKRYNFLSTARCLIDLCAAPGGWLQVAAKYMPVPNVIVGVDLAPIKPIPRVITLVDDITTEKCRVDLRDQLKTWKADVVLNDGAPNVGTAWVQDAFTQSELVLHALKLATEFLNKDGTFVTKVFRSKDYNNLMWVFQQLFSKVEATKPPSSRNISAEIFVVCRGFIAPKRIDPRLLDPRHVFADLDMLKEEDGGVKLQKKLVDVFHPDVKRRHRDGYEDGDYTLHKSGTVKTFIEATDPVDYLGSVNEMLFEELDDEFGKKVFQLTVTTDEIKECCRDLGVLGKKDFKGLLRWRLQVRKLLNIEEPVKTKPLVERDENDKPEEKDEHEKLLEEMENLTKEEQQRLKREKKKKNEKRRKLLERMQLNMQTPEDIGLEQMGDHDEGGRLFEAKKPKRVNVDEDVDEIMMSSSGSSSESSEEEEDVEPYDSDDPDAVHPALRRLEEDMDMAYQRMLERRAARTSKRILREKPEWEDEEEFVPRDKRDSDSSDLGSSSDESMDSDVEAKGEERIEVVSAKRTKEKGEIKKLSGKAKLFYSQDIFDGLDMESDEASTKAKPKAGSKRKASESISDSETEETKVVYDSGSDSDSDWDAEEAKKEDAAAMQRREDLGLITAEAITLAQALVNRKKSREGIIDDSFHRRTYHDDASLPQWFIDEEKRHNKPNLPVTKEAMQALRERQKALDARPIKKVAEAKGRKKLRAQRRAEKLAKKQSDLADNPDMTEGEKANAIERLARAAKSGTSREEKKKREVKLVVAKGRNRGVKGRPGGVKGRYKMVDSRMKKDLRAEKRHEKKSGKKRKGKR